MRPGAVVLLGLLLVGACARRAAEPTTPREWHAARLACGREASDDCFWDAVSDVRRGWPAAGVARLVANCRAGHGRSCGELATMHRQGHAGLTKDGAKARAYAQQGCALGDPFSCHEEGIALFRGLGGPKDLARSTTLYEQACEQGDADACRDFGIATSDGRRDAPDEEKAKALYRRACPASPLACSLLARTLVVTDPTESRRLSELACELEEEWGCYRVGEALEQAGDRPRALRYYRSACAFSLENGCTEAARLLLTLDADGGYPEAVRLLQRPDVQDTPAGRARLAMAHIDRFGKTPEHVAVIERVCHEDQHQLGCAFMCFMSAQRATSQECASACAAGYQQFCQGADGGLPVDGGVPSDAGARTEQAPRPTP